MRFCAPSRIYYCSFSTPHECPRKSGTSAQLNVSRTPPAPSLSLSPNCTSSGTLTCARVRFARTTCQTGSCSRGRIGLGEAADFAVRKWWTDLTLSEWKKKVWTKQERNNPSKKPQDAGRAERRAAVHHRKTADRTYTAREGDGVMSKSREAWRGVFYSLEICPVSRHDRDGNRNQTRPFRTHGSTAERKACTVVAPRALQRPSAAVERQGRCAAQGSKKT